MERELDLGRVAVSSRGVGARRVLRALHELARSRVAGASVMLCDGSEGIPPYAREADEVYRVTASIEDALRRCGAHSAWLGAASLPHRIAFAEACARAGVRLLGPPLDVLRALSRPEAISRLAAELGLETAAAARVGTLHLVEAVVARDRHGAAQALGVGDASLRRLDGVVVLAEAPSPALTSEAEVRLRELAVRVADAAQWVGVCSVQLAVDPGGQRVALVAIEALADAAPAIEALAGVDLARLALTLGGGAALEPHAIAERGHAFAARLEADDPEAPAPGSPGAIELLRLPSSLGVRADAALMQGDEAARGEKLAIVVARGETRAEALARLEQALSDADVLLTRSGSSKAWLLALCQRPEVRSGRFDAGFLPRLLAEERLVHRHPEAALLAAAIEGYEAQLDVERARFIAEARRGRPRVGPSAGRTLELRHEGLRHTFHVQQTGPDQYRIAQRGTAPLNVRVAVRGRLERRLRWRDQRHHVLTARDGLGLLVEIDGVGHAVAREPTGVVNSPIPAVVVAIPVEVGQAVSAGDPVARIESMKSELEVRAPSAGVVREILAAVNSQVDAGGALVRLWPADGVPEADATALPSAGEVAPPPTDSRQRYFDALAQLVPLLLGFDIGAPEIRRLTAEWRERAAPVPHADAAVLAAEELALGAFADLQSLFGKSRIAGQADRPPPIEELWRYLHEPEKQGEGLTQRFRAALRRALAHYGVSLESPGRSLELALLRIQKAHERAADQAGPLAAILERRLEGGGVPPGFGTPDARDVLERIAEVGAERFPLLADLARELRFRRFDQPALEQGRAAAYAGAEADLALLAQPSERDAAVERLVECPQPLTTLLVARMASSPPDQRAWLVETLLRRYYRVRPLSSVRAQEVDGVPSAYAEYDFDEERFRVVACFAPASDVAPAARVAARLVADTPTGLEAVVELYLGWDGPAPEVDALLATLTDAVRGARFERPMRRVSIVLAMSGRGLGREQSQHHFVLRGGPDEWHEDRRFRGVHYLLFERMQLGRLSKFDLERLPSAEDIYLYRGVAAANPKDERLFAMAEVRDVSTVRDPSGRVVRIPQLERTLLEAAAGMRVAQSKRPIQQRLFWNRIMLGVSSPLVVSTAEFAEVVQRLASATEGLGLEMLLVNARVPDPATGQLRELLLRAIPSGTSFAIQWDAPTRRPLEPMTEFQQRIVQLRRRGLVHPFEIIRMLVPPADAAEGARRGSFVEYDLDEAGALVPVERPPGQNVANVVVGVVRNFTERHPEGLTRVILLGDPGREMGSVAEPECRRILAALDLAERTGVPLEWFEVCAGAKISMTTGTENMDWISAVLRRLIDFTQRGGEVNVVVTGITVGAQPYWNAEATMLMHTRGILVMVPGSCMVLTGKQALDYSGSVSAEDNEGIGGYDRIMGPNGQAQYRASSVADACSILMRHYDHCYVVPGERFPRRAATTDPRERDVREFPHGPEGGAGFETVGDVLSVERNPERKKPFEIRRIMAAVVDQDHPPLERWPDWRGGETGVVWDAHLGGNPVCLVGIQSRPLPRLEFVPADGPESWSAGTLFPNSSKKVARAVNAASNNRPLVVLANLSGFDGSPESMRRLQLEYGAEIGRAVVNFRGPIVFCVVSRYHGGAFVVFAKTLNENIEAVAVAGARASVIGGAPAAAVVFAREVDTRTRKDPRVVEAERAAATGGAARARLATVTAAVRSEKLGEVGEEFDRIHSVERALRVGSLDRIIAPAELRPYLIDAVERGMAKFRA